jgi:protease-4
MPRKKRGAGEERVPLWKRISIGRIISIFLTLVIIFILLSFLGLFSIILVGPMPTGNIAVIPIKGTITTDQAYGSRTSSTKVSEWIKGAEESTEIQAIMLDINSGGGSAVASDEIAQAIIHAEKPVVAVIRDVGASGAYWVASAADVVYANRMSITGSIGVIGSYLEIAKLLDDYNVTYRRLVSGEHKDMGIPFKEMTEEEELIFQDALDSIHAIFIESVAENRNMPVEDVKKIATGRFVIGVEAKRLGLVDELGTRQDAIDYLEKELNITADLAEYRMPASFSDIFASIAKNSIGLDGEISLQT